MTRTSAIFGVVSVLTAAIVGGVFIRQKIISDALYWRAWVEAEGRWKREIRKLERDINALTSDLKTQNKNKENTGKEIERYKRDIEEGVKNIKELEEKMDLSRHYFIPKHVAKIVNKNFDRQSNLKEKIKEFNFEIDKFVSKDEDILSNEENDFKSRIDSLRQKIEEFSGILEFQKAKLKAYAYRRIRLSKKFKQYKTQKEETKKQQKNLEKKLNEDKNLLNGLGDLIKKLQEALSKKTLQLLNLRTQGPIVVI